MSEAEELLSTLSATDDGDTSSEPHIVIGSDRYITVPDELKRIAVQYDHDVETVTFDCPRYWDDHDMSKMAVYINYLRSDAVHYSYIAQNITVDDEDPSIMHFDWTISRNVTEAKGKLIFLVCIRNTDKAGNEVNHWNSELCDTCYISEGLEVENDDTSAYYSDIVVQWYKEVLKIIDEVETTRDGLIEMLDNGEFTGPKGDPGVSPVITVSGITGGHRITITDINGTQTVDVMDTIVDGTEAVNALLNNYVHVGDTMPTSGPKIWFDTSNN